MAVFFSPAKINLFLHILFKRPDAYHAISTLTQTISLGDTLYIEPASKDSFSCSASHLPLDGSNLVTKALQLFRRKTGIEQPFRLHLEKKIPIQAGLGGGSGNAATLLWACNLLTESKISLQELKDWGTELGSDVPSFFSCGTALCSGKGEKIQDLSLPPSNLPLVIVKPFQGLSTPDVYKKFRMTRKFSFCQTSYHNDLEQAAFEVMPSLLQFKKRLLEGGFDVVQMTGSGSAFFCLGKGCVPEDLEAFVFPAHFLYRAPSSWYPLLREST